MSGAGDKQIKFTFAVDQRSMETARSAIRQLTSEIKTLVETMSRAGSGISGMGGGGMGGGGGLFGGMTGRQGGVNPSQQATVKGATSLPAQGIAADARALSQMAKAGTDAIRQMTGGLREGVQGQVQQIEQLKRSLRDLNAEYAKMAKGGQAGGAYGGMIQGQMRDVQNQLASAEINQGRAGLGGGFVGSGMKVVNRGGVDMVEPDDKRSWFRRLSDRFDNAQSGGGQGGGGGGIVGMIQKAAPVAAAAAFVKGWDTATTAMQSAEQANVHQQLNQYAWASERRATFGDIFGGTAMAIRGGNISKGWAMAKALRSNAAMESINDVASRKRMIALETGYNAGLGENPTGGMGVMGALMGPLAGGLLQHGTFGASAGQMKQNLANFGRYFINEPGGGGIEGGGVRGGTRTGYDTAEQIEYNKRQQDMSMERAKAVAEEANRIARANPWYAGSLDRVYGEAQGRVSLGRQGGYSGGVDPRTHLDRLDVLEARLTAQGYGTGEYMGARRSLGQTAGWGARGALGTRGLSMGYGGLQGVEQLFNVGAQFGAGGNQFINAVQGTIGRHGMDVTAGGQLAQAYASSMMGSGQFGFGMNGVAGLQGLAAMGATGSPGGDMRMSRMLQAGLGAYGSELSGGIDPLQGALNPSAAVVGMPGQAWAGKNAVMKLSPEAMLDILRSGRVPSYLTALGVGYDDVKSYHDAQQKTVFSRNFGREFNSGSAAGGALEGIQGMGGDWVGYVRQQMKGKKMTSANLEEALTPLSAVLAQGTGMSPEASMGDLMAQLAGEKDFAPGLRGGGAHAAGMAQRDKAALGAQSGVKMEDASRIASVLPTLIKNLNEVVDQYKSNLSASEKGGEQAGSAKGMHAFDTAVAEATRALNDFTGAIKAAPKRR